MTNRNGHNGNGHDDPFKTLVASLMDACDYNALHTADANGQVEHALFLPEPRDRSIRAIRPLGHREQLGIHRCPASTVRRFLEGELILPEQYVKDMAHIFSLGPLAHAKAVYDAGTAGPNNVYVTFVREGEGYLRRIEGRIVEERAKALLAPEGNGKSTAKAPRVKQNFRTPEDRGSLAIKLEDVYEHNLARYHNKKNELDIAISDETRKLARKDKDVESLTVPMVQSIRTGRGRLETDYYKRAMSLIAAISSLGFIDKGQRVEFEGAARHDAAHTPPKEIKEIYKVSSNGSHGKNGGNGRNGRH